MLLEFALRFVLGGLIVAAFAVLGDVTHPKRFAGIFGAAPSVALATLSITFVLKGGLYASVEGRSMMAGAAGLAVYSLAAARLLGHDWGSISATTVSVLVWGAVAFGLVAFLGWA